MNEAKVWIIERYQCGPEIDEGWRWQPYYSGVAQTLEDAMNSLFIAYAAFHLTRPMLRLRNVANDDFIMGDIL